MARREDPTARDRILAAATDLYYERGVNAVGIAEIVATAGTGRNVLYRHFPGQRELVLAYLRNVAERMDAALPDATAQSSPKAQLTALAQHVARTVSQPGYRGCPFRNYLHETRDTQEAAGLLAIERVEGLRARIAKLTLELDVAAPEDLAFRIWLLLEGVYAAALHPDRAHVATNAVRQVQDMVAESLRCRETSQ